VQTVGREIYVGYAGYTAEASGGVIRAIDYKTNDSALSCAVILTKENMMKDFLNVVKVMRSEYRRLNENERRVLMAVYNNVPLGSITGNLGLSEPDASDALNKLVKLGYADIQGHITSYGINAVAELSQSNKQED
jgi:helix-turn-helix protein